jgi:small-conductance mechanosensitive channel
MLLMAAKRTKGAASNREPFVRQKLLGDFGITYQINVYCDTPERMQAVYSELHENIQDVFNEHGVAIMTPAYVADPAEPKFVPREKWFEAPAVPPGGK